MPSVVRPSLLGRLLRRFAHDRGGATAVEFGLLAVPFFTILTAILETAVVLLSTQFLDTAVQEASRLIRTGQAQSTHMTAGQFRSNVCSRLYGMFDCNNLYVDVSQLNQFSGATIAPPVDNACTANCQWNRSEHYTPGGGSQTVLVQVYYRWPVLLDFPGVGISNMADGSRLMGSSFIFKNEPF